MKSLNETTITISPDRIRFLTLKEFQNYCGLRDRTSARKRYNDYLFTIGKPGHLKLSNYDIYKIDGVLL